MMGTQSRRSGWRGLDLTDLEPPLALDHEAAGAVAGTLHADDVDRFVTCLRQGREHRRDTIVRVGRDEGGWIEVRCSFVPVEGDGRRPISEP